MNYLIIKTKMFIDNMCSDIKYIWSAHIINNITHYYDRISRRKNSLNKFTYYFSKFIFFTFSTYSIGMSIFFTFKLLGILFTTITIVVLLIATAVISLLLLINYTNKQDDYDLKKFIEEG